MKKLALLSMLLGLGLFAVGCDQAPKKSPAPAPSATTPPAGADEPAGGATATEGATETDADHDHADGDAHTDDEPKGDAGAGAPEATEEKTEGAEPKEEAGSEEGDKAPE